ncbi:hypothetical protein B0O80DRAFT_483990 [Mortierella sp. GBAus27b]|nr:hypothetical protein BGX31_000151 [Mortierella sp. GBA43]KAI8360177.1 hypothetical protein B0O80DRAFT_483990 [Mortierella sp. GBAus27b]
MAVTSRSATRPKSAVWFIGNSGVGKVTLLSQLGGNFKSAFNIMRSHTQEVSELIVTLDGQQVILMDFPGLYMFDGEATKLTVSKFTSALKRGYNYKLFYVMKAHQHLVTSQDLFLMSIISKCIRQANNPKVDFRVIINQIHDDKEYKLYEDAAKDNFQGLFSDPALKRFNLDIRVHAVMLVRLNEAEALGRQLRGDLLKETGVVKEVPVKLQPHIGVSTESPTTAVLFVGNPGTGKTTFLSELCGNFRSRVSFAEGSTQEVSGQGVNLNDQLVILIKVPGPYQCDQESANSSAASLYDILRNRYHHKLFFVLRANNHGFTPQDLFLLSIVSSCIRLAQNPNVDFRVIVNQIQDDNQYNMYKERGAKDKFRSYFASPKFEHYQLDIQVNDVMLVRSNEAPMLGNQLRESLSREIVTQPEIQVNVQELNRSPTVGPATAILFIGNPGAGRKFLLSQIWGDLGTGVKFQSIAPGITGQAVTLDGHQVILTDFCWMDETDDEIAKSNIAKLDQVLKSGYNYKLFIVLKAKCDGLKKDDLRLLSSVNQCIRQSNGARIDCKLIVNQIRDDDDYEMYEYRAKDKFQSYFKSENHNIDFHISAVTLVRFNEAGSDDNQPKENIIRDIQSPVNVKKANGKQKDGSSAAIMFIGDTSAGKSTILSHLHRDISWPSSAQEIMEQTVLLNGQQVILMNVPGLQEFNLDCDPEAPNSCASKLTRALSMGYNYKLLFVLNASSHGFIQQELSLMSSVNKCVHQANNPNVDFRVIINHIRDDHEYKMYEECIVNDKFQSLFASPKSKKFELTDLQISSVTLVRFNEDAAAGKQLKEHLTREIEGDMCDREETA